MKTRYRRQPLATATALFLMALASPVVAENVWNPNAANSNWQDGDNWSEGVPTSDGAEVWINSSANAPVIDGDPLAAAFDIHVGHEGGSASLTIVNDGKLEIRDGTLGFAEGSAGVITVDGTRSSLSGRHLFIGLAGNGTLDIRNGGTAKGMVNYIGHFAGSTGFVTVEGPNSFWETEFSVIVGNEGDGTLSINDGGVVISNSGMIGSANTSTSIVTVDGANSAWRNAENLSVGFGGNGTLNVRDGGVVGSGEGIIGRSAGGKGTVIVTGENSLWANAGNLTVGQEGMGSLTISDRGHVDSDFGISVGHLAGSQGAITVTGPSSALTGDSDLRIGQQGDGTLTVENGGEVITEGFSLIGAETGGRGAVVITGAGSTWANSHTLTVGADGVGALTIADGGKVTNFGSAVGDGAGSQGAVTVTGTGSTWESFDNLSVGRDGVGTLVIEKGGEVSNRGFSVLGQESNSQGTATLTGTGSKWTGGTFVAGGAGLGVLNVSDGGVFSSEESAIGLVTGAEGKVTISGVGSAWTSTNTLSVGFGGTGTLDVRDHGAVNAAVALIGKESGSMGTATIDGAGSILSSGEDVTVGYGGNGMLNIRNGGLVEAHDDGLIGDLAESTGIVTVEGTGSTWKMGSELLLGGDGKGTLTIRNGGTVDTASVSIATDSGSTGTLNIGAAEGEAAVAAGSLATANLTFGAGTGTLNFNHTGNADGSDVVFVTVVSGAGAVNQVGSGTTVLTGTNTYTGATTVSAGTLAVDGSIAASALTVQAGGTLTGTGTVGDTVIAGTLSPGHSIGTLTVDGDLRQASGSAYDVELGASGSSDQVHVTGTATIESQVNLRLRGDVSYVPGTRYTVLTADGGVTGDYQFAGAGALTAFLSATDVYDATHAYLDVSQSRSFASVAGTPNQIAAAHGTESLGSGHVLFDKVLLLPDQASAQAAFDALSGELHASTRGALREQSSDLRNATAQRDSHKAGGFWTQGLGAWGHVRNDGNAARIETDRTGLLLGADWAIGESGYVGVAGGYGQGSVKVNERHSSTDIDTLQAGVYGGLSAGRFGLDAGIGYARHSLDSQREVAFAGYSDHLKADYDAQTLQAYLRGTVQVNEAVSGFIEAASVDVKTDGFRESGGAAALTVQDDSTKATYATLGVRLDLPNQSGPQFHGSLGWRQRFGGEDQAQATGQFAGGQPFTVLGAQTGRKAFVGDVGLDWALGKNSQLSLSYAGAAGGGAADNRIDALFSMKF